MAKQVFNQRAVRLGRCAHLPRGNRTVFIGLNAGTKQSGPNDRRRQNYYNDQLFHYVRNELGCFIVNWCFIGSMEVLL